MTEHDLHRQLVETHAKVAELGIALNDARAELERTRAPSVEGDVRALATALLPPQWNDIWARLPLPAYEEIKNRIASALQAYGDERAREEAAGNAVCQVLLEAERVRCEQIVDAVRDEQRRIADARVAQVRRELGGFSPTGERDWVAGWGATGRG